MMLFTGEGWGKSAAAIGYAVRARGRGWPTTVVQFLKGGSWNAAEISQAGPLGIHWPVLSPELTWGSRDPTALAQVALGHAREALAEPEPSLVVLDELTHAIHSGWLEVTEVVETIQHRHPGVSVIITGRHSVAEFCELADTVTRFDMVEHDGKKGILST
ncbi:cob(I)yrinic acid a,c-diamide adenosyltransferase [Ruania alkalisoli]|uniref:Cob(I)yrinic acid a,c-diamide adenosyltransferase n=2 Tax=Ruania alkalisoli TaxID=2779775 RepID=A0A7M1T085_9MICO|nr:cob(I)yrinic acid a,c-diamide adenosyltransferase [Ruania alkalisoli]